MSDLQTWKDIILWTTVYTATAWIIIFIARLVIVAPFQLFRTADEERATYKSALDDRAVRQRALDRLWDLRQQGVEIRNADATDFHNWNSQYLVWHDKLLEYARIVSVNLERHLKTLNEMHGYPSGLPLVVGENRKKHERSLGVMSEMLRRLEKYLERDIF